MDNPYQSPIAPCHVEANRRRTCASVFCVVLLSVLLNVRDAVRYWPELAPDRYLVCLISTLLWLPLPLLAVVLVWRGRGAGRWILLVLFGLRGVGDLLILGQTVATHPMILRSGLLLTEPWRSRLIETVFYSAAAVWFLTSPSIRGLSRPNQPQVGPGYVAEEPKDESSSKS